MYDADVPFFSSYITRLYWPYSKKAAFSVDDYKFSKQEFPALLNDYTEILQDYLNQLVPEFAPFNCAHAFLYQEPLIPSTIADLIR